MTLFDWSKNLSPPFNQSDIKLKPGVTWSLAFSHARGRSRNCTLNSHWLLLIYNHRSDSPLWLVWFWPITLNWNVSFDSASWCFILFHFVSVWLHKHTEWPDPRECQGRNGAVGWRVWGGDLRPTLFASLQHTWYYLHSGKAPRRRFIRFVNFAIAFHL